MADLMDGGVTDRDEVLANFQACTGIEDVDLAIYHLQESDWNLLNAISKVLPQDSQTLPSERVAAVAEPQPRLFRNLRGLMDQGTSDSDTSRMEDDEVVSLHDNTMDHNGGVTSPEDQIAIAAALDFDEPVTSGAQPISVPGFENKVLGSASTAGTNRSTSNAGTNRSASNSGTHRSASNAATNRSVSIASDFLPAGPSGSASSSRLNPNREIKFCVTHGTTGVTLETSLAECETVETLKTLIHAQFEIPPCQQTLLGWPNDSIPSDNIKLGSLKFPSAIDLMLVPMNLSTSGAGTSRERSDATSEKYTLIITDLTNNETYPLEFVGQTMVRDVKDQTYMVTDIPVRSQAWGGWPQATTDSMPLRDCGLERPSHRLTVKRMAAATSSSADLSKRMMELTDGSETSSDVEDLTESYPIYEDDFAPEINSTPQKFLIADFAQDECIGTVQFADNFYLRYGACHPMFFTGTLEDASRESCLKPAKERKQLAIYLHHEGSVMSNVFCQQVLCNESIVSFLANNFVIWGWDVTHEANRQLLLTAVSKNFGTQGVSAIRSIERDRYPVIIVVSRVRSATEISSVIHGQNAATVDELMTTLIQATDMFQQQRIGDVREEEEREARERVKREQDEAYEASLQADRAKDEAKRAMEQQKHDEETKQRNDAEQAELERAKIASTLPPEPGNDCQDPICSLKCRLPGGKIVSRKFLYSTTLRVLFDFLFSQGFSRAEFKFLTTYPKRDLTEMPETTVMKGVFTPQDTLIVEER